ncbi:MAG: RidA family protein [Leptospirillia bacterium]
MTSVADRLKALGVTLPPCPEPIGDYVPALISGDLLYTSGMLPLEGGALAFTGRVGAERSVEEGIRAARLAALNAVAAMAQALGGAAGLDRIERIVQVTGHILSTAEFSDQPQVLNGASEWLGSLFGERGQHTRLALGAFALPKNATVEVALVARIGTE